MSIKTDLYRIFVAVASKGTISSAAKALFMTQPAVSQAIMQLETEMETRLFTRTPKGVILTYEGQVLFGYAQTAMNLILSGEQKIKQAHLLHGGELRLGVGDTTSKSYLLPYLDAFHQAYPGVRLKIINRTTPELCELVKSGVIDLAICNLPIEDQALEIVPCLSIQDCFVASPRFIEQNNIVDSVLSLEAIATMPTILLEPKSNSRQFMDAHFLKHGIVVDPEIELGSHDLLLSFAGIHLGMACVIREFSEYYFSNGTLLEIPLAEPMPPRSIGLCHLKSVSLSPASQQLMNMVLQASTKE